MPKLPAHVKVPVMPPAFYVDEARRMFAIGRIAVDSEAHKLFQARGVDLYLRARKMRKH